MDETVILYSMKKLSQIAIFILVTGGLITALAFISKPSSKASSADPKGESGLAVVGEGAYDFGTISMAKGKVRKAFQLQNTTSQTITLTKLSTSCMCTKATLTVEGKTVGPFGMPGHAFIPAIKESLNPGVIATVTAEFDPAAHGPAGVGAIDRAVTLENDSGAPVEFRFQAFVEP